MYSSRNSRIVAMGRMRNPQATAILVSTLNCHRKLSPISLVRPKDGLRSEAELRDLYAIRSSVYAHEGLKHSTGWLRKIAEKKVQT